MTLLIDCHTHLTSSEFAVDRDAVLERATEARIGQIVIVGQDAEENRAVLAAAAENPRLVPFLGLHPDRFADRRPEPSPDLAQRVCDQIRETHAASSGTGVTGIGEVGLDRWVCHEEERREMQSAAFAQLIDLAKELSLPLNVHSRAAGRQTIELLTERGAWRVLMHAFDGKAANAMPGVEAGFVFSIPPSIVRSPQKQKLVRALPLENLALETDSPVLGPERDQRNEPANIRLSLRAIAEIKELTEDEVAERTSATARRLLGLPE